MLHLIQTCQESNYVHDFVGSIHTEKFFAFPQPLHVLSMFVNLGHFSASCSYKKKFLKIRVYKTNFQSFLDKSFKFANIMIRCFPIADNEIKTKYRTKINLTEPFCL